MNTRDPYAYIMLEIDSLSFEAVEARHEISRLNTKAEILESSCRKLKAALDKQISADNSEQEW